MFFYPYFKIPFLKSWCSEISVTCKQSDRHCVDSGAGEDMAISQYQVCNVQTSQVRLGSSNSWGQENTGKCLVILQMEQQLTW